VVEVKFCGLTRPEDAALAVELGAAYAGVIFAGGQREVSADRAAEVLAPTLGTRTRRVGVMAAQSVDEMLEIAATARLDILQLSYGADTARRIGLRGRFDGALWGVSHVRPDAARSDIDPLAWMSEGIAGFVLDAAVAGRLGGTGVALDWGAVAPEVRRLRQHGQVVLAGGLTPANVAQAVREAAPDVVDVSSGVERVPGIKDPDRMRAFIEAARATEVR
jgi:phosphoribosylanthranilate isomerase